MNKVTLQKSKERPIKNKHHWIFSGAIQSWPSDFENGSIYPVYSNENLLLGYAYFNKNTSISGRMLNFEDKDPFQSIKENIQSAYNLRQTLLEGDKTNCYRLINGEGDGISGLIVDKYNDVLVIQISTLGLERIKDKLIEILVEVVKPKTIFEKSKIPSRKIEGLSDFEGHIYGDEIKIVEAMENGIKFKIDLYNSHKTGMYLDQREMRSLVERFAKNRKVLNCFSYTGGFSLFAHRGGALKTVSVDISEEVTNQAKENFVLNNFDLSTNEFVPKDVFRFFREEDISEFDFVILDPPAFAKKKEDFQRACDGYRDINRNALKKLKAGSFLLTCSCSYHVDFETFQRIVFQASVDAKRNVRIVQKHRLGMDHTINIFHPEADYLKSLLLYVE